MNKSKFLKKSLAMLLAVMLVVAMIPMSASAADAPIFVNDGTIVSIGATNGKLTGSGAVFNDALTYGKTSETITVVPAKAGQKVYYKIDDGDQANSTGAITVSDLTAGASKKITFFLAAADYAEGDTKSKDYTVNLTVAKASSSAAIKEAYIPYGAEGKDDDVKGTVNNTSKTIVFELPWDMEKVSTVNYVMENPLEGFDEEKNIAVVNDMITVVAQDGRTAIYTVVAEQADCMTSLSIGGAKAVVDEDDDTKYTVTLPEGTDLEKKQVVSFQVGGKATATIQKKAGGDAVSIANGGRMVFEAGVYTLTFTSKTLGTKSYEITVNTTASSDASIEEFVVYAGAYSEKGTIKGDQLAVVLSAVTTDEELAKASPVFTVAEGATVAINGAAIQNDGTDEVDLTKTVTVQVTAADGTTAKYYQLTATKAAATIAEPKITAASMTYEDDNGEDVKVTGVVSGNKITFAGLPYAAEDDLLQGATYTLAKTPYTLDSISEGTSAKDFTFDPKSDENDVWVMSDSGTGVTYTFVFTKAAAKTGKSLTNLTVTTAADATAVTAKNTYKLAVSADKITGTLPYSVYNNGSASLVLQYTLSEGAKLYNVTSKNVGAEVASGFYPEDDEENTPNDPKTGATTTVGYLKADPANQYVIADESAVVAMKGKTVTVAELAAAPYAGHVTILSAAVTSAPASREHVLKSIKDENGIVVGTISNGVVSLSVPYSFSDGDTFPVEIVASDYATVTIGSDTLKGDALKEVEFSVDTSGETPVLEYKGSPVTTITVTSEYGESNPYTVGAVTVRDAETSAALTEVKVNNITATISYPNVTVTLPRGSDLTKVSLDVTAQSKMAFVDMAQPDKDGKYDVSEDFEIEVTSEDGRTRRVYVLKVTNDGEFSDVPESKWYYNWVYEAAAAGIVQGTTPTTYSPNNNIRRDHFALMVVRMLDVDVSSYTDTPFSDVNNSSSAAKAIAYCADKGIIDGVGNGRFAPASYVTREQAAKIIAGALDLKGTDADKFNDDAKIANWAKTYVYACKADGIFEGDNKGNFNPKNYIKRSEAAKVMVVANDNK